MAVFHQPKNPLEGNVVLITGGGRGLGEALCTAFGAQRGTFEFLHDSPPVHCGEEVLAQLAVVQRFGGCGSLPWEAYNYRS